MVKDAPQVVLPYPHRGQRLIRAATRRFNWLCAGRRWRKTTLVLAIAVEAALAGERILWCAPVYDQVRLGWNETKRAAGLVAAFNHSRMEVTFPHGGRILFRSLDDPDNVRGHTADGVVIDEAAAVNGAAWYEVLRPMLVDTAGWLWAISTPKGHNWFWQEHNAAQDRPDSAAWQAPTLGVRIDGGHLLRARHPLENDAIAFDEIRELYATTPERVFRQEILAEFHQNAGAVYRGVRAALRADRMPTGPVFVGGDWAQSVDYTVFTALQDGHVIGMDRFNGVGWELQLGRLRAFCDRYQPQLVLLEQNSIGGPLLERAQTELPYYVEGFTTTAQSKRQLIDAHALAVETGAFTMPATADEDGHLEPVYPQLVNELEAFEYVLAPSGGVRLSAPSGVHDDCVISAALAWRAQQSGAHIGSFSGLRGRAPKAIILGGGAR